MSESRRPDENRDCIHGLKKDDGCTDCEIHMLKARVQQIEGLKLLISDNNGVIVALKSELATLRRSNAEIGRDAILAYSSHMNKEMLIVGGFGEKTAIELYRFACKSSEIFANNLTANSGDKS